MQRKIIKKVIPSSKFQQTPIKKNLLLPTRTSKVSCRKCTVHMNKEWVCERCKAGQGKLPLYDILATAILAHSIRADGNAEVPTPKGLCGTDIKVILFPFIGCTRLFSLTALSKILFPRRAIQSGRIT